MPDVHDTPEVSSADRPHVMDRTCWCNPEVWRSLNGDDLIVHNEVEESARIDGQVAQNLGEEASPDG